MVARFTGKGPAADFLINAEQFIIVILTFVQWINMVFCWQSMTIGLNKAEGER